MAQYFPTGRSRQSGSTLTNTVPHKSLDIEEAEGDDVADNHGTTPAEPALPTQRLPPQPSRQLQLDTLQPEAIQLLAASIANLTNVLKLGNATDVTGPRASMKEAAYPQPTNPSFDPDGIPPSNTFVSRQREEIIRGQKNYVRQLSPTLKPGGLEVIRKGIEADDEQMSPYEAISANDDVTASEEGASRNGVAAIKSGILYSATFYPSDPRSPSRSIKQETPIKVEKIQHRKVDSSRHREPLAFEISKLYGVKSLRQFGSAGHRRLPHDRFDGGDGFHPLLEDPFEGFTPPQQDQGSWDTGGNPIVIEAAAGTILYIYSPQIIRAIDSVTTTFPGLKRDGESAIVTEPYCILLYFREQIMRQRAWTGGAADQIRGSAEIGTDTDPSDHISLLYSFVDQQFSKPLQLEQQRWSSQPAVCTFPWLWHLFAPETLVYEKSSASTATMQAFRVKTFHLAGLFDEPSGEYFANPRRLHSPALESYENAIESIIIHVTYLRHNGRGWVEMPRTFTISPFQGEKPISELPIIPVKYFDDPEGATRDRLIRRGSRYEALTARSQVEYHGESLSGVRRRIDSRIIVDLETYHFDQELAMGVRNGKLELSSDQRPLGKDANEANHLEFGDNPAVRPFMNPGQDMYLPDPSQATVLPPDFTLSNGCNSSDENYMICAHEIYAYVLSDKEWVVLAVESISDCIFSERLIDDLQISSEARRFILALSQSYAITPSKLLRNKNEIHNGKAPWSSDFIANKGRGQILLLHGKPGVGKTTTAECIAELTKRPLLTITCGDLGNNPVDVEQGLTRWLRLGALWNGIILFDEADIFLEARAHGDIARNSLISVFLRALEYYQGLLFLTTNRVGSFDEAILSRVHVVLHFPNLTDEDRKRIWDTSFRKLKRERADIEVDFTVVNYAYNDESIRGLQWNGREIRNAFNTMVALAEYDAKENNRCSEDGKIEVRREHLQEVTRMSSTFKQYMQSLVGMDAATHVKSLGLRDDTFDVGRKK